MADFGREIIQGTGAHPDPADKLRQEVQNMDRLPIRGREDRADQKPPAALSEPERQKLKGKIVFEEKTLTEKGLTGSNKELSPAQSATLATAWDRMSAMHAMLGDNATAKQYSYQARKIWSSMAEQNIKQAGGVHEGTVKQLIKSLHDLNPQLATHNPAVATVERQIADYYLKRVKENRPSREANLLKADAYYQNAINSIHNYGELSRYGHLLNHRAPDDIVAGYDSEIVLASVGRAKVDFEHDKFNPGSQDLMSSIARSCANVDNLLRVEGSTGQLNQNSPVLQGLNDLKDCCGDFPEKTNALAMINRRLLAIEVINASLEPEVEKYITNGLAYDQAYEKGNHYDSNGHYDRSFKLLLKKAAAAYESALVLLDNPSNPKNTAERVAYYLVDRLANNRGFFVENTSEAIRFKERQFELVQKLNLPSETRRVIKELGDMRESVKEIERAALKNKIQALPGF